jgi:hypothetical protein
LPWTGGETRVASTIRDRFLVGARVTCAAVTRRQPRDTLDRRVRPLLRAPGIVAIALCAVLLLWHACADACGGGFARRKPDGSVALTYNDAWRAALMRVGQRTVLSLQNSYQGPPEDFALVVPVPVVLERANVRTLPAGLFERIDRLSSPRLFELFEEDPCEAALESAEDGKEGGTGTRAKGPEGSSGAPRVKVEAEFSVDEYDVVILSATESTALEHWLLDNGYGIPPGAEPYLRPYVVGGSKFFVAKVNASRVKFRWGRALLSPLRFDYETPTFTLPTRLGLVNSSGVQDLVVYVLGAGRYEPSNYENVFIPTNLAIREEAAAAFDSFYASLFDRTAARAGVVVTEYAAPASKCELCPDGAAPLSADDLSLLGADVATAPPEGLVLTRLHARYGKETLGEDLVFRPAPPVRGGSDPWSMKDRPRGAQPASINDFQARYIARHPWQGTLECSNPAFGTWRASSDDQRPQRAVAAPVRRDLDVDTLVLGAQEEATAGEHGSRLGRRLAGIAAALFATRESRAWWGCGILGVTPVLVALLARRQKRRVPASVGFAVLLVAVCLVVSTGAKDPHPFTGFGRLLADALASSVPLLGLAGGVAGVVCARRRATMLLAGLAPLLGGFVASGLEARGIDAALAGDVFDLAQSARIFAESASEVLAPTWVGCLWAGVLLAVAAIGSARELGAVPRGMAGAKAIAPVVAIALAGRLLLWGRLEVVDGVVVVVIAALAVAIDRAGARLAQAPAIGVAMVAAVVLLDLASRAHQQSVALGAMSGESVDPFQRGRILGDMVHRDGVRIALTCVDATVVAAFAFARARGARRDGTRALRSREAFAVSAACAIAVALATTVLAWTGIAGRITAVGHVASRTAWTDGSRVERSAGDPERAATLDLAGPALVVEGTNLHGAAGFEASLVPYGPELVARIASEGGATPLLIAPGRAPMASVVAALAPLLAQQQGDYRLAPRVDPRADLGAYGLLVAATEVHATPVEIVASPIVHPPAAAAIRGTGFVLDGSTLHVFALRRDGAGFSSGDAPAPARLDLQDGQSAGDVTNAIASAGADGVAVLAVAPDTPIETVGRALDRITSLRVPSYEHRRDGATGMFRIVVLSPALATFETLRQHP